MRNITSDNNKAAIDITIDIIVNLNAIASPFGICKNVYIAADNVWVSPGIFDTKVIVAPNSPNERAKLKVVPTIIPGKAIGVVIVKKTIKLFAPSVLAASSILGSIISIANFMDLTIKGNPIIAQAKAAPDHLNAKLKSKYFCKNWPTLPFLPKTISKIYPVTTGGNISGRFIKLSIKLFNGNSRTNP